MDKDVNVGFNQTGIHMSPIDSKEMAKSPIPSEQEIVSAIDNIGKFRALCLDKEGLGSIPIPATISGMANVAVDKLSGQNIGTLIDKLSERIAFERGGVRLYDAIIGKIKFCQGFPKEILSQLENFRKEEKEHFEMLTEAVMSIGGDPTVQTPCADVVGVMAIGLMQVVTDPRTNFSQCLNALLTAELTDNASWELLISLAKDTGHDELVGNFTQALEEEKNHLLHVKQWLRERVNS